MNIEELSKINSSILSEEEMIYLLGGDHFEDEGTLNPDSNTNKCNKCDKCDKCTWFCG